MFIHDEAVQPGSEGVDAVLVLWWVDTDVTDRLLGCSGHNRSTLPLPLCGPTQGVSQPDQQSLFVLGHIAGPELASNITRIVSSSLL